MTARVVQSACQNCGRRFRLFRARLGENGKPQPARGITFHHLDPNGHFCTQRCSTKYAVAHVQGGTR